MWEIYVEGDSFFDRGEDIIYVRFRVHTQAQAVKLDRLLFLHKYA